MIFGQAIPGSEVDKLRESNNAVLTFRFINSSVFADIQRWRVHASWHEVCVGDTWIEEPDDYHDIERCSHGS